MLVYLDICCFNRPFDDQTQLRVRLESESKLSIQEEIRATKLQLVWSYMMDYENSANPFQERQINTSRWKQHSVSDVGATAEIIAAAHVFQELGFAKKDALHLACAVSANCNVFFTTDHGILKRKHLATDIAILNPIDYINRDDD